MECQVNVKSQSELDIGGLETCYTIKKAVFRGQTPFSSRNLGDSTCGVHKGLARSLGCGLFPGN